MSLLVLATLPLAAQHHHHGGSIVESLFHQQASGTALLPAAAPMEMLTFSGRRWSAMVHGLAYFTQIDQSGPRGQDERFSTNWLMVGASRSNGRGVIFVRTMLSAEPWTIDEP